MPRLHFSTPRPHWSIPRHPLLHLIFTPPIGIIPRPLNQTLTNRVLIAVPYYLIQRFFPPNPVIVISVLPHRAWFITQRVNLLRRETFQGMQNTCQRLITTRLNNRVNMVRHYHNTYPLDTTFIFQSLEGIENDFCNLGLESMRLRLNVAVVKK